MEDHSEIVYQSGNGNASQSLDYENDEFEESERPISEKQINGGDSE